MAAPVCEPSLKVTHAPYLRISGFRDEVKAVVPIYADRLPFPFELQLRAHDLRQQRRDYGSHGLLHQAALATCDLLRDGFARLVELSRPLPIKLSRVPSRPEELDRLVILERHS